MDAILSKIGLDRLKLIFAREKIYPETVRLLSIYDFQCLGVSNRSDMMKLRTECISFGGSPPAQSRQNVKAGAPEFIISKETLQSMIDTGFKINDIANLLSVSESTVYRRMRAYNISSLNFTDIEDSELDNILNGIVKEFPRCGETMLQQILRGQNIIVSFSLCLPCILKKYNRELFIDQM